MEKQFISDYDWTVETEARHIPPMDQIQDAIREHGELSLEVWGIDHAGDEDDPERESNFGTHIIKNLQSYRGDDKGWPLVFSGLCSPALYGNRCWDGEGYNSSYIVIFTDGTDQGYIEVYVD